jgi:hypothetical protein
VCERTVWRVCRDNGWWSVFGEPKTRKHAKPGTPAHEEFPEQPTNQSRDVPEGYARVFRNPC